MVYTTKICTMTTCTKSMNIYYSEVTLLLESFIFLFEPIYKNIYFTITKLDIFENREILFYTFFFNLAIHWKFVLNFFFKVPITTLICAQNVRNMFSLIIAGLFIPIRVASFISASKTRRNVTNLTKRQKKSTIKNNNTHK